MAAALLVAGAGHLAAAEERVIPATAISSVKSVTPLLGAYALSPDGRFLAFESDSAARRPGAPGYAHTALRSQDGQSEVVEGAHMLVYDSQSRNTTDITPWDATSFGPAWSRNGTLGFFSNRGGDVSLWLWSRGAAAHRATRSAVRPIYNITMSPVWSADAKSAFVLESATSNEPKAPSSDQPFVLGANVDPRLQLRSIVEASEKRSATARLVRVDIGSGGVSEIPLSEPLPLGSITGTFPSPRSDKLAVMVYVKDASGQYQRDFTKVATIDLRSGLTTIVVPHARRGLWSIKWAPDDNRFAFASEDDDLYVASADGSFPLAAAAASPHPSFSGGHLSGPWWSRDGSQLIMVAGSAVDSKAVISGYQVNDQGSPNTLWSIDVASRKIRKIGSYPGHIIADVIPDADGFVADPRAPLVLAIRQSDTSNEFARVREASAEVLFRTYDQIAWTRRADHYIRQSPEGRLLFGAQGASDPPEIWEATPTFSKVGPVTRLNAEIRGYGLGRSIALTFRNGRGIEMHAAVLLPHDYVRGRRYPTLFWQRPGNTYSEDANAFGLSAISGEPIWNFQFLTSRGFVVVACDSPFSSNATLSSDIVDDVKATADAVVAAGYSDSSRLGIFGISLGGWSTIEIMTRTSIFRTGVSFSGFTDWVSQCLLLGRDGTALHSGECLREFGGTLQERGDAYLAASPLLRLDQISGPLLIIQGGKDTAVSPYVAAETFVALRVLGKPVEYAEYPGEEHDEGGWSYDHEIDVMDRLASWLEIYLKAPPTNAR